MNISIATVIVTPIIATILAAFLPSKTDALTLTVPVTISIPAQAPSETILVRTAEGKIVPSQVELAGNTVYVTWMIRKGTETRYTLVRTTAYRKPETDPRGVKVTETKDAVDVYVGGKLFTRYVFAGSAKPYCYPIIGPTGKGITRNYPMRRVDNESTDHVHHRSLWFTHGNVNGIDFWGESPSSGKIVHRKFERLVSGPLYGRIVAVNDWIGPDGKKVCEDTRDICVYRAADGQIMDFKITIRASDGPVTFGDTKEGMFGIRLADSMTVDKGKGHIQNSRGDKDAASWGRQAEWCDYYGSIDGDTVGVAIMDMPLSFRSPTYWHVRTYGLFAANPFGLRDFTGNKSMDGSYTIPSGKEITFWYRLYIHQGTTEESRVADIYQLSTQTLEVATTGQGF
ncbi:MAG: PmoA family protein [Armatimonadetes bacterium]|nr:PmoA family protein [Armatimonadota bacterium]